MSESVDLRSADLDELIRWLDTHRRRDPETPLSQLVRSHRLDSARLIDLACVDLMQRRRMGHSVRVEDYVADMPELSQRDTLLDLIDAELCVASELKQSTSITDYTARFPSLSHEIQELLDLEGAPPLGLSLGLSMGQPPFVRMYDRHLPDTNESNAVDVKGEHPSLHPECQLEGEQSPLVEGSLDFVSSLQEETLTASGLREQPVDAPEWFVADQCIARTPGRWLVRGHDSVRGTPLAMKVTELPLHLDAAQSHDLLDACEAASKVRNPRWIGPRVAAVQQRHLGVVRDWSFSQAWTSVDIGWRDQAKRLADVAYTVEAAHRVGATHGGLNFGNVLVSHEGRVLLIDGASSHVGVQRWCHGLSSKICSFDERVHLDVQDLVKLVSVTVVDWQTPGSRSLLHAIQTIAQSDQADVSSQIGEWLIQFSDGEFDDRDRQASSRIRWRQRLTRWFSREAD